MFSLECSRKGRRTKYLKKKKTKKRKWRWVGEKEKQHKCGHFGAGPCAGHMGTVNPQHPLGTGELSLGRAGKFPALL